MKTHPITFRAGSRISCLRQDFVAICGDDNCAAAVLGQMMYWHEVKMAHQEQSERENEKLSRMGKPRTQVSDLWVYKSQAEMQAELLNIYGKNSVGAAFSLLLEQKFLLSRSNDEDKRDRTKQYLFHVANVQNAVNELPLLTMDYPARDDVAIPATGRCNSPDREMQCPLQGDALPATGHSMRGRVVNPKTTSETTTESLTTADGGGVETPALKAKPAAEKTKAPARTAKAKAPADNADSAGNASQQFIDAFTAKQGNPPILLGRHHSNLQRYRSEVGENVFRAALAGFFVSWLGERAGYDAGCFVSKGPDHWTAQSGKPQPNSVTPAPTAESYPRPKYEGVQITLPPINARAAADIARRRAQATQQGAAR